jgi:hypothetical protein
MKKFLCLAALFVASVSASSAVTLSTHREYEFDTLAPASSFAWGAGVTIPVFETEATALLATLQPEVSILGEDWSEIRHTQYSEWNRAISIGLSVDIAHHIVFQVNDQNSPLWPVPQIRFEGELGDSFVPGGDIFIRLFADGDLGTLGLSSVRVNSTRYYEDILSDANGNEFDENILRISGIEAPFSMVFTVGSFFNQPSNDGIDEPFRGIDVIQIVPEPTSALLLGFGGLALLRRRRR